MGALSTAILLIGDSSWAIKLEIFLSRGDCSEEVYKGFFSTVGLL